MKEQEGQGEEPVRTEYISVQFDCDAVGKPGPCLLCGSDMDVVFQEYELGDNPTLVIKNDEPVPGYRCRVCEAEYCEPSTTLRLYKESLVKLGDRSKLREPLEQGILSLERLLSEKHSSQR